MEVELDARLVEDAVFRVLHACASGTIDAASYREYRSRLDQAYEQPRETDGEAREDEFQRIHAEYFARLGLDGWIRSLLLEFPLLDHKLDRLVFVTARSSKEEGAELLVRPGSTPEDVRPAAFVALRPERFLATHSLGTWLRRELLHVSDMVDPDFGYRPRLGLDLDGGRFENLIRDRYRVLWDLYVDARLVLARKLPVRVLRQHVERVRQALPGGGRAQAARILRSVRLAAPVLHADLLGLAKAV
ncbi:MAG: hypothetical protein ACE5F1_17370 [Planctomycetota bacterium]